MKQKPGNSVGKPAILEMSKSGLNEDMLKGSLHPGPLSFLQHDSSGDKLVI